MQTGTGLGLAIVSSIVTSEVVGGKVDVWSQEGVGTEIKVTFNAEVDDDEFGEGEYEVNYMEPIKSEDGSLPTISLVGFDNPHRGTQLLERVLRSYFGKWWHLNVVTGAENGDIIILNEDVSPVISATERHDINRPFIVLSGARSSPTIMHVATEHERIGGFCRILYKPGGPSRLRSILKLAIHARSIGSILHHNAALDGPSTFLVGNGGRVTRRNSEENHQNRRSTMAPRSSSALTVLPPVSSSDEPTENETNCTAMPPAFPTPPMRDTSIEVPQSIDTSIPSDSEPSVNSLGPLHDPEIKKPSLGISTGARQGDCFCTAETSEATPDSANTETIVPTSPATTVLENDAFDAVDSSIAPLESASCTLDSPKLPVDDVISIAASFIPEFTASAVVRVGESGTLLKSSIQPESNNDEKRCRVLVVEDNGILRNLL